LSVEEVLEGLAPTRTRTLERRHGNGDLVRALELLGVAGPFRRVSPWELEDEKGRHLVHAGGYAALPFGEAPPALLDVARRYLASPDQVSFPQQTVSDWRAALETNLVALLASVAPSHADSRVVFSNSGTEAVEIALKIARATRPEARWLVTFTGAYHGKTLGSLSVTPNEAYQRAFRPLIPGVVVLPYGDAAALEREILARGADQLAAVLLEPLQGEGGVVAPPDGFLADIERLRVQHGIPVIADEIQSGLGRTGHWFASVAGGLDPDVVTLAKPLSGGLVPVGATIARSPLMEALLPGFASRRHSSTFAGNGLAMAIGLAALEQLVEGGYDERAREAGARGLARLRKIAEARPGLIRDVRGAGMLFAIELEEALAPGLLRGLGLGRDRGDLARLLASGLAVRALHRSGVHACLSLTASGVVRLTPALDMPPNVQEELWSRVARMADRHPRAWRLVAAAGPGRLLQLAGLARRGASRAR
jgi:acetylornithine/succinyldiaminopimelate/putrescine aminotransferase